MDDVPMGSSEPFEDEFALAKIGLPSPYAAMAFPRNGPALLSTIDLSALPEPDRLRWEKGFLWLTTAGSSPIRTGGWC